MAQAYFGTKLSPNIIQLPNGSRVCLGVRLSRSGIYQYRPDELGLDSDQTVVNVYRDPKEVFSREALASFNAMPVTLDHPANTPLDIHSLSSVAKGFAQNIRQGTTFEEGEYMIGDLVITDPQLINEIENNVRREVSCGYNFTLRCYQCKLPVTKAPEDSGTVLCSCTSPDRAYEQIAIRGDHIAVVQNARAGHAARINDSAEALLEIKASGTTATAVVATSPDPTPTTVSIGSPATEGKPAVTDQKPTNQNEKRRPNPMSKSGTSWLDTILGRGLRDIAKDDSTPPEELAQAFRAVAMDSDPGAVARNEEMMNAAREQSTRRLNSGNDMRRAKDADEEKHVAGCKCNDCMDSGKRMSRVLDGMEEFLSNAKNKKEEEPAQDKEPSEFEKKFLEHQKDYDGFKREMKDGLEQLLSREEKPAAPKEEPKEAAHEEPAGDAEMPEELPSEDAEMEEEKEHGEEERGMDTVIESAELDPLPEGDRPKNPIPGHDRKAKDKVIRMLRDQRVFVANPKNFPTKQAHAAAKDGFNQMLRAFKGGQSASTDRSYAGLNNPRKPAELTGMDKKSPVVTEQQDSAAYGESLRAAAELERNRYPKGGLRK